MLSLISSACANKLLNRQLSTCANSDVHHKHLYELRQNYSKLGIDEHSCPNNPMQLFTTWISEAQTAKLPEPNAMCLSTALNNCPSSRYVLLKKIEDDGFVWFTNYESRKAEEIDINPNASLTFWWAELERQVRIEGVVSKVSEAESDEYFSHRPRGSQIGAWASDQSRAIGGGRAELEMRQMEIQKRFENVLSIPRPPHWGGYRLKPIRIEFWKGRADRLHDRLVYARDDNGSWTRQRLQP